jgi:hypothetical protein
MLTDSPTTRGSGGRLALPAAASIGAGAVHAVAIGAHSEHAQAVLLFSVIAAFQLGWGVVALRRSNRALALVGLLGHAGIIGGFIIAKTAGIGFVDGLAAAEPLQVADAMAAVLALIAVAGNAVHLIGWSPQVLPSGSVGAGAALVAVLTLPAMLAAGRHDHTSHQPDAAPATVQAAAAEVDHGHDDTGHEDHAATPMPYDPSMPIDLSGMEGVTPTQQAAAENLVSASITYLPQFADPADAEAAGYHSIGDGLTGYEHFVNWTLLDDDRLLDANFPESLVYRVEDGVHTLEAAMYMLREGDTLDDAPELGGPLTQWHIHNDLCYTDDPVAPKVRGLREPGGPCNPPLVPGKEVPMIHVWIVPHPCGPFAALEGVGAGAIAEDEERLCDHAHGAGH